MKKFTLFLVAMMMSLFSFSAQPKRIYAYGLSSTLVDKVYTFSFNANETPTSGKIIFYDATSSDFVGEIALTNPVLGKNDVEIAEYNLPGKGGQQLNWSVELSAAAVTAYEKIYEDAASKYCRGYSNVDVSPESDHFGSVYVGDRVSNVANSKFYVYSPVYSIVKSDGYDLGADNWGFGRFAIASDGTLWLTDYTDNHSGMFLVNPNDLTTSSQFFAGARYVSTAPKGVIKNGDIETGSSLACATFYGEGADTKLVTVAEDYKDKSFPVAVFNVGNADGTLKTRWEAAPDILFSTGDNAAQNFDIKACEKGVWVAQSRSDGNNASGAASLCFYTWDGTCTWKSHQHTDIIKGSLGGGIAITPDEKQLIMKIEGNTIAIFDIAWNGTTPTLTKTTSFDCKYPVISSINLDYAGNIVTAAGTGSIFAGTSTPFMRLAVYSNPTNNNTCEVPAKKADVVTKKTSRAWAYDLELSSEGDSYTFSFKAATSADATLIFNQDGVEVGTINCGHVSAGLNTITKTHDELLDIIQKSGDFNWSVRMIGEDIVLNGSYLTELTAAGQGLDFYLPQGVVVDNNPESETFSSLFIAEAKGGKLSVGPTHKQGIYHYSQTLTELNPTDKGIMPSNITLANGSQHEMHRIAINPVNNHVAFAHNISGKPAVWSVPANNPAGEATNLIAGTAITMPNSICFDENGVLYVMDNANATTGGTLYKVVDGVATKIAQNTIWQHSDNSLAYDGRGGIWIAQSVSNNTWPSYEILSHINSEGNIDWKSSDNKSTTLFSNGNGDGYSKRGQVAYSMKDDLLVFGGNCRTHIFQVTYDANTGIPSLGTTYKYRTPFIGGSKSTANIDGLSFDYAGDLYVMCATRERLYKYVVPTNNNTCTTPAKKLQVITLVSTTPEYSVTINVNGNGTVTGANTGTYLEGSELTLIATPAEHYDFVNWTEDGEVVSTTAEYSFIVTKDIELTANFQEHAKYTITAVPNDENMGTVTGGDIYYVGESVTLKATAKSGYVFAGWADGEKNATRTVTVSGDATYTANFQVIAPRAWAYDLKVVEDGDNYKFTFNTTAAGTATLLFADIDGNPVAPTSHDVGPVAVGANTVLVAKAAFTENKDVYWSVKIDGEAIPAISEITDQSRGIYDFYNMMGVVVDNDPNSDHFGKIYIQQSYEYPGSGNTAERNKTQKAGIFIYDQGLNELNVPANTGIQPQLPYTLGSDRQTFKRMTINPANGDIAFCNNKTENGGAYSVSRSDLTSEAVNLTKEIAEIKNVNALCFDKDGNLYVVANVVTNYTNGDIYKIADDGTYTKLTPLRPDGKKIWVDEEIAIVSDGRGGIWVAQKRDGITQYSALFHVNFKQSKVDFVLEENQAYSDWFIGTNRRGAIAYDVQRDILAVHGPNVASLFSVAYDGEGVPTITKLLQTPNIGSSNIDGLAFDYAGDLYLVSSGTEKFYKYTLPTADNICTVPAPASQKLVLGTQCEVTVIVNDPAMGSVEGAGQYEKGATVELEATANEHYQFVNWTKGAEVLSEENPYSFTVQEDVTITANFAELPKYTIIVQANNEAMGSVDGGGTVHVGESVEIKAIPNAGYAFVKWDDNNTSATRTVEVVGDKTYTAIFQAMIPRAWTYDLRLVEEGDNYKFTFKATSAGDATLLFTNKAGTPVAPTSYSVGAVEAGEKSVTIAKSEFGGTEDIYWSVQMDAAAIENMVELTDASGSYDFFMPQDVKVDNSPNSMYFGQIYVAAAQDGACRGGNQKRGIFVYDQKLAELNTPNVGYLPANVTLTDATRHAIHRLAVNPINGYVAFSYNVSGSSAVWSMNPADMSGNAVNLIDNSITAANSICFDEEGALYVMDNANAGSIGGQIYKEDENGKLNLFAAHNKDFQWANADNALASDGRGGLWIAQNRWQVDDHPVLSHVDKNGNVDFAVTSSSSEALKALFPSDDNNASYRGQCAYYAAEDILAFGGNKEAVLFKVTYDANNAPTNLEKLMSTGKLGTNIDGLAFDYAGDLYVASATAERFYKFVVPTTDNTCTVPAPESQIIKKEARYTVTVVADPAEMGTVTEGGEYKAGEKVTLTATANTGYRFVNWTKDAEEVSTSASFEYTVPAEDVTLTANFEPLPEITYDLNGGVWNKYGWTSKKDMYNALLDDWRAYSGSTRPNVSYEEQLGIGNSSKGIPTTIYYTEDRLALQALFTDAIYAPKWGWLATYVDAVAVAQSKATQPTTAAGNLVYALGNFFGEDNVNSTNWMGAVDFTGEEAHLTAFAPYWGQTFPMPTQPTEEIVLNAPYKEGYEFDGWYANSDFSGEEITVVDENTNGTLYAKWLEHFYTRDVTNGNFGTICLPYASASTSGAEFYEVAGRETDKVLLDQVTKLEAGRPYIFRATAGKLVVIYEGEEALSPGNYNGLYGTFTDNTTVTLGNYIVYQNELRLCGEGCYINANRAYLILDEVSAPQPVQAGRRRISMSLQGENQTTALDNITEEGTLPAEQATKIIHNGQLIIIRDGVMYNAQGQKL